MSNFRWGVLITSLVGAFSLQAGTTQWTGLGGWFTGEPAVAKNTYGRLEAFVRGGDNSVWHSYQNTPGGTWSGWTSLSGQIISNPAVGVNSDGTVEVFVLGTDNAI